jgi:putative transposase
MRKRPRPDQIAAILRDSQSDLDAGLNIDQACRKAGIGPTTYYRWKALQEDPISNEQLRIPELEAEVARLKLLVAELALDHRMLQEALNKSHDRLPTSRNRQRIIYGYKILSSIVLATVGA